VILIVDILFGGLTKLELYKMYIYLMDGIVYNYRQIDEILEAIELIEIMEKNEEAGGSKHNPL
jgi:hypothetical protein